MHCIKSRNSKAFTFIELIITTAMVGVVALAIYATFSNGLEIWERLNQQLPGEDLNIFLDKFSLDLKNCFKFSGIDFLGSGQSLAFASFVNTPWLGGAKTVGRLNYYYDTYSKILKREQSDYSALYNGDSTLIQSVKNINSVKFLYYAYDPEKKKYVWLEEWMSKELPLAVRVEIASTDVNQGIKFNKTIEIPNNG